MTPDGLADLMERRARQAADDTKDYANSLEQAIAEKYALAALVSIAIEELRAMGGAR